MSATQLIRPRQASSEDSSGSASSTSLRDPSFNICQQALCDDGKRAAFFIPFILLFFIILGFLGLVRRRRRARDGEKRQCDLAYMNAHKRGESFDYASIPSHNPTDLTPQYAALEKDWTLNSFSLPPGVSRSSLGSRSFSVHSYPSFKHTDSIGYQSRDALINFPDSASTATLTRLQKFELEEHEHASSIVSSLTPEKITSPGQRSTATFDVEDLYAEPEASREDSFSLSHDSFHPLADVESQRGFGSAETVSSGSDAIADHQRARGLHRRMPSSDSSTSRLDLTEIPRGSSRNAGSSSHFLV